MEKRPFTLKQYIVILFLAQEELIVNINRGISYRELKRCLWNKFKIKASCDHIQKVVKSLVQEDILRQSFAVRDERWLRWWTLTRLHRVIDFDRAFRDIKEDRRELKRYRDRHRQQKRRKAIKEREERLNDGKDDEIK